MNKFFLLGVLIVLSLLMQEISAECNATVWGKIGFSGCNNSAAINATIQIMSGFKLLNSTQTDENGIYNTSISFNGTSKNISIRMMKKNEIKTYYDLTINCEDNISKNHSIIKEPIQYFSGNIKMIDNGDFKDINETDKVEVEVHLKLMLEDSKNVNASESINSTITSKGSYTYRLSPNSFYCSWPTKLYLWAEPTENYYYRIFDYEYFVAINSSNYTSLAICSYDHNPITKDFIRFPRKSVNDNCSYIDECKSNICNQISHTCQCTSNSDCADSQICNATKQCQNLICSPPNGSVYNHTCVNCTDNATCGEQFCNLTVHACQPIYCTGDDLCRSNQICNTTMIPNQCKNLHCFDNQRAFNHTCVNCSSFDFDNNNITDIFDAVYLLEYISGEKKDISPDISPGCADVDNNGIVDLFDAAYILYYLL